jgi:organic hydroperoxide reductase OsmC/OhrA
MKYIATQGGPQVPDAATVTAIVGIGPHAQGGFGLDVQLNIMLPGLAAIDADAMVNKAHLVCPYSIATRNNVPVRLVLI